MIETQTHTQTHRQSHLWTSRAPSSQLKKRCNAPYFCDGVRHRGFVVKLCDFDEAFCYPEETLAREPAFGRILAIYNPDPLKAPI